MSATIPAFDLYAELGLDDTASPEAIEAAYRALIKRHHPDRAGESGVERSKRLNVAHAWLRDPVRRDTYDRTRAIAAFPPAPPAPTSPSGDWATRSRRTRPPTPPKRTPSYRPPPQAEKRAA